MDLPNLSLEEVLKTFDIDLNSDMGIFFEHLYNRGVRERCKFSRKFLVIPCTNGDYILLSFNDRDNKQFINITSSEDKFPDKIHLNPIQKDEICNFITKRINATGKLTSWSKLDYNKLHLPSQTFSATTPATPMTWAEMETLLDKLLADNQMS